VERKVLLEVLAGELPKGTIRFNSRVSGLKKSESRTGISEVELQDGSTYSAKVCHILQVSKLQELNHLIP
jgi:hypothetical protein